MSNNTATVNFDTEFSVPSDCLPKGEVDCRVVKADCDIVDIWKDWVTFKIRLLLKIRIRSGDLVCLFKKEIILKDTVWLDCHTRIKDCEVIAAACKCILHRGKIHCNLTVKVLFSLIPRRRHCCHEDDWCDFDRKHDHCCDDDFDHICLCERPHKTWHC